MDHLQGRQCKTHYKQGDTKEPGLAYRYNAGNALREWYSLDQDLWSSEIRPGAVCEREPEADRPGSAPADDWTLVLYVYRHFLFDYSCRCLSRAGLAYY